MLLSLGWLALSTCIVWAQSLTVTQPSAAHWWIANELDTLAWTAGTNPPSEFSVFLANPDTNVLTDKLALISEQPLYDYSETINPGKITPSTGYTIQLTDVLNSSNIYATSEAFEIKAEGSAYPPQTTDSGTPSSNSTSNTPSGASTSASNVSASASSTKQKSDASKNIGLHHALQTGGGILGGMLAFEALIGFLGHN